MTTETTTSGSNPSSSSHFLHLSQATAALVAAASPLAAQIDGGRRLSASGTVFAADGVIVAASHNVERDEDVIVGLEGGKRLPATLVGRDASTDLAVLRVDASGLAVPQWSDLANLAAGQLAVLVGRPGRQVRAALAMISDVRDAWRSPAGAKLERYVELDAARERGFSGSVVVDAAGQPLGIASSGLLRRRGLVVPGATLRRVVESLLAHGRVRRGFLGIGAYPVRLPAALEERLGQPIGLILVGVQPDSPAAEAGLVLGDVLLGFEGQPLADLTQLHALLSEERIGKPATLRILRGGEPRDVSVTVGGK
ncbi:MAG TPA: S1C family serine protease [Thermoanaerobaculia bacterium]|nr:S1C family serine protease [Thermoanaerobaculia bacterium]